MKLDLSVVSADQIRDDGHNLVDRKSFQSTRKHFFCCGVDQALVQTAQKDGRDCLFGNVQKPSGHSSEQSVLDDPT